MKTKMNITLDQFMIYEHVRIDGTITGHYDMQSPAALNLTNLPREVHFEILCNYAKYKRKFLGIPK